MFWIGLVVGSVFGAALGVLAFALVIARKTVQLSRRLDNDIALAESLMGYQPNTWRVNTDDVYEETDEQEE